MARLMMNQCATKRLAVAAIRSTSRLPATVCYGCYGKRWNPRQSMNSGDCPLLRFAATAATNPTVASNPLP